MPNIMTRLAEVSNDSGRLFKRLSLEILVNGVPVYKFNQTNDALLRKWEPIDLTNIDYTKESKWQISLPIAEAFLDAKKYYWDRLGKE
jgi:hypothetical protein